VANRAIIMQHKTKRPEQFEITEQTRTALSTWIHHKGLSSGDYLFPSRIESSPHLSRRQYARILETWLADIGLDPRAYAFPAPDQGIADLSTHEEPTCGPAAPRPHQGRKHLFDILE
jgi:hypothetical protein